MDSNKIQNQQGSQISIFVKCLNGDLIAIDCDSHDSLITIKRKLQTLHPELPINYQQFFKICTNDAAMQSAGEDQDSSFSHVTTLHDLHTLSALKLGNGDTLMLYVDEFVRMQV
jgi:hypothetical protein